MQHGVLEGCCQQSKVWGKPALRRTKASFSKTHTLPENAWVLWIRLRKETHFTFIENHLLEEKPASAHPLDHMTTYIQTYCLALLQLMDSVCYRDAARPLIRYVSVSFDHYGHPQKATLDQQQ